MKLMFFVVQKQRMNDVIEKNDGAIKSDECQTAGRILHLARFWCLRDQVSSTFISGQGRIADVDMNMSLFCKSYYKCLFTDRKMCSTSSVSGKNWLFGASCT